MTRRRPEREPFTIDTTTALSGTVKLVSIRRNGSEVAYKDARGVWHGDVEAARCGECRHLDHNGPGPCSWRSGFEVCSCSGWNVKPV